MAKLSFILLLSLALLPALVYSKPKVTKIRFFLQDSFSGKNRSVYNVAQSDITSTSPTMFGQVCVVDDPLTVEPDPNSEIVGRAQGMIAFSDLNEQAPHLSVTFVFTSGEYKGSTLSAVGRNPLSQKYRQMPIVGGTGAFELAQGIVTTTTHFEDTANSHTIFEYNLAVITQYSQEIINMYV